MKRLLTTLAAVLVLLSLVSCGTETVATGYAPGQTEAAYSYTHGGYVGRAVVSTDAEGKLNVELDEAFLPHTLAIVDMEAAEWTEENTASYVSHGDPEYVAKYVSYAGTTYVGTSVGGSVSYVEAGDDGAPVGGTDLEKLILKNQATMADYYSNIAAGGFKVMTSFDAAGSAVTTTSYGGLTKKNAPGYWGFGTTWIGNITIIEEFAEKNGVAYSPSEIVRATEEDKDGQKKWSVADAVTAATASDFKDYFGLIQRAVGQLKMQ